MRIDICASGDEMVMGRSGGGYGWRWMVGVGVALYCVNTASVCEANNQPSSRRIKCQHQHYWA